MKCSVCGIEKEAKLTKRQAERLLKGWHRRPNGETVCKDDWSKQYILRAVTFPVLKPLDGRTWDEFGAALRVAWSQTTGASNWIATQLYAKDTKRTPDLQRLPKAEFHYLYPELRKLFPDLPPQTVVSLERAITARYGKRRFDLIWRHAVSLPTFRYPQPMPIHNQAWSLETEDQRPVVSFPLGGERWRAALKGGPQFHRQRMAFDQMLSGAAVRCELALYRGGEEDKEVMAKLVAWLPREKNPTDRSGALLVRSGVDVLLFAIAAKEERKWAYNADHVRRWAAEHRRQLDRWSEDTKFEHRPKPALASRREAASAKYGRRMASACHEIAAALAGYADRRRFSLIEYDDSERNFCTGFPWARLRALVQEKCNAAGIQCEVKDGEEKTTEIE